MLTKSKSVESRNENLRKLSAYAFALLVFAALVIASAALLGILGLLLIKGIAAINVEFLSQPVAQFGASGGIANQIIGSLLMVLVAGVFALPVALGVSIFISEYINSSKIRKYALAVLHTLNTVPSIAYGIFGLIFFVYIFQTGISWFVGSIILAFMMLPTVIVASFQAINAVPTAFREQAYALGFTRSQTVRFVLLPKSFHGAVTGLMIGLAAAIGETAPIMFIATAFSGVSFPTSLNEPVSTLPTHILALVQQATNPQALENAWGAAFVLVLVVLIFSAVSFALRVRIVKRFAP